MIKENQILELAKNNKRIVTTRLIDENNIPRIYLTKLVKEKKLFRIDRGVYSTAKKQIDPYYAMQVHSHKIIFSHFTSLNIQGFYKNIDKYDQLSVPQGYNAKKFDDFKVFYDNEEHFGMGLIEYKYKGNIIKIYDIERAVCDIIRDRHRFDEIEYYKFINYYFSQEKLNYKKLLEYSTSLKINDLVHHYLAILKA